MSAAMEQKTVPTLHHLNASQSFPVLMALEEAASLRPNGLKYNLKLYQRQKGTAPPELKKISPLGKAPVMVVETVDGSGDTETLTESQLLLQYISDNYTKGEWIPVTSEDKKRDIFFTVFSRSTFQQKVGFCVIFDVLPAVLPVGLKQLMRLITSPVLNHFSQDLVEVYKYLEDELSESKPWLSGERMGLADFNALFAMDAAVQCNFAWDARKYPKLAKWHKAMMDRESYKAALKKGGDYDLAWHKR